jgi:hypothetical protein
MQVKIYWLEVPDNPETNDPKEKEVDFNDIKSEITNIWNNVPQGKHIESVNIIPV